MSWTADDTIAAISSAVEPSARGVVRISGPEALALADACFRPADGKTLSRRPGYTRWPGSVTLCPGGPAVPAEAYVFRSPKSYTRQDLVEIHTCGGAAVLSCVLDQALACGARQAEAGEFTARAFLAGAMDLAEAEGVAALIAARSDGQIRAAGRLMRGVLSQALVRVQDRLADLLALVEADIDFSEEPIDFISPLDLQKTLSELSRELDRLQTGGSEAQRVDVLPRVVLIGPPNAGKSTLLNRLTGLDRAICSPWPGTTRDVLTAPLRLDHREVLLIDGAGIESTSDRLIQAGQIRIREQVASADFVCLVVDVTQARPDWGWELPAGVPRNRTAIVVNKVDLVGRAERDLLRERWQSTCEFEIWPVSARTGTGCERLKRRLDARLGDQGGGAGDCELALNARHRQALSQAREALQRAQTLAASARETVDCAELLAIELREASAALGTITGEMTTEDLLGRIFSRFCIGK